MSEIQVTLNPAENSSLTSLATVSYVQQQIAALQVAFDAALTGVEASEFSASSLTQLPTTATMSLSDSVLAIIGGVASKITTTNLFNSVGTTVQSFPLAASAVAGPDYFVSVQNNMVCLQQASAISQYVLSTLPSATKGVVELTGNTALDSSVHNNKILVCSVGGITISAGATWVGSGVTATIINVSTGVVNFSSAISVSSGVSNLQAGQSADLVTFSYSSGNVYFVTINGATALTNTGVTVTIPVNITSTGSIVPVSGQVFPSGSAVQVALSSSATVPPSSGWVNATVSGTSYTAALTPLIAQTYYVWSRLASNNAVYSVSSALTATAASITINQPTAVITSGVFFQVTGTVFPANSAVIAGISLSNTIPPTSWVSADNAGNEWGVFLTSYQGGPFYVWAAQASNTGVTAVSAQLINTSTSGGVLVSSVTTNVLTNGSVSVSGTVSDAGGTVVVGLSQSATTAPTTTTNATVSGNSWTVTLTAPATAGTYYVWASETSPHTASTVSPTVVTVSNAATGLGITSYNGSVVYGKVFSASGTVADNNATVKFNFSSSNTTPPSSYPYSATVTGNNWAITQLATLVAPGTWYLWVQETTPNLGATVSGSITIAAPASGVTGVFVLSSAVAGSPVSFCGVANIPSGTVQPSAGGLMYYAISTSNTTMPALTNFGTLGAGVAEQYGYQAGYNLFTTSATGSYYLWLVYVNGNSGTLVAQGSGGILYSSVSSSPVIITQQLGTIALVTVPSTATQNSAFTVAGTVGDSGGTVQVGISTSATTAPGSYSTATVTGNTWTCSLTSTTTGTFYVWAKETTPSIASVVSSTTVVVSAPLTPVVISTFTNPVAVGANITVSGTCESGASISVGLSTSATTAPTSTVAATVTGTSWTATVTSSATGSFYVWAQETTPHVQQAVSTTTVSVVTTNASIAVYFGANGANALINYNVPSAFSVATNGAGPGGTPSTTIPANITYTGSPSSCRIFFVPASTGQLTALPSSLPSSGEEGVSYGTSGNQAVYLLGSYAAIYLAGPNVAGSYYLTAYFLNSGGTITGVAQSSLIVAS